MRRLVTVCLLLTTLAGCAATSPPHADPSPNGAEPRHTPPGQYVVLYANARLYRDSARGAAVRVFEVGEGRARAPFAPLMVGRVVSTRGDMVEIETAAPGDHTHYCDAIDPLAYSTVRLRFWVERADLAPVLVEPIERAFDDGTRVSVAAGVPVVRHSRDAGRVLVWHADVAFMAPVTKDQVGLAFVGAAGEGDRHSDTAIPRDTVLRLGGRPVSVAPARAQSESGLGATFVQRAGAHDLLELRRPCARLVVQAPAQRRSYDMSFMTSSRSGTAQITPRYVVDEGTPVYWPDGPTAGHVRQRFEVVEALDAGQQRLCRTATLGRATSLVDQMTPNEMRTVRYCVRRVDLRAVE